MRRLSIAFGMMIVTFPLISLSAIAQTSPEIVVWKLNLAKSKLYNSQPPKNETRIVEPDGDGVKVHISDMKARVFPTAAWRKRCENVELLFCESTIYQRSDRSACGTYPPGCEELLVGLFDSHGRAEQQTGGGHCQ